MDVIDRMIRLRRGVGGNSSDQVTFSARNPTIPSVSECEVVVVLGASVGVAFL